MVVPIHRRAVVVFDARGANSCFPHLPKFEQKRSLETFQFLILH
jgi:hypothetical protein